MRETKPAEAEQEPFKLAGSVRSDLPAEDLGELIDQIRREQAELARRKLESLYGED
jgi:hypothetical protein